MKTFIIAIAALGFAGALTLTPSAPAQAFFLFPCAKGSKHADSERCKLRAKRKAERRARWQAFWSGNRKKK
ncbi:MAG: hypothetical protein AAGF14_06180 [Pseudomonadota bacterium]